MIKGTWIGISSIVLLWGIYLSWATNGGLDVLGPLLILGVLAFPISLPLWYVLGALPSHLFVNSMKGAPFYYDYLIYAAFMIFGYLQWFKFIPYIKRFYRITTNQILIGIFSVAFFYFGYLYISSGCLSTDETLPGFCDLSDGRKYGVLGVLSLFILFGLAIKEWLSQRSRK